MKAKVDPLVSVVTPFYNTEKYLEECIESVLNQTYTNFEYILVNNCSSDKSLEIANGYALKDNRIKVVDNENFLSQVQNYNHALKQISANSRYCKIVQADDWIYPQCLNAMVDIAEINENIAIVGSYYLCGTKVEGDGLPYDSTVISGRDVCRLQLLHGYFFFGSPTSVMYRADIVRNKHRFYSETSLHEDTEICYEILLDHDFGFVHQVLSYTRVENESITSMVRDFAPNSLDKFIIANRYAKSFLDDRESKKCVTNAKNNYFQLLAKSIFQCKGQRFWDYQSKGLQSIGYKFSWLMLWKHIIIELVDIVFNPKKTAGRIMMRMRK
jgi:glycosyltransferase involved in cell wall biosynthesis